MLAPVNVQCEHSLQLYHIHEIHFAAANFSKHKEKKDEQLFTKAFHLEIMIRVI